MKSNMKKIKMLTDICMMMIMPLLMLYSLTGEELHEWFGVAMFLLFLTHHLLNWRWHKNIRKGKYNLQRSAGTIINVAIGICMIFTGMSGIMMSKHIVHFDLLNGGISFARKSI